MGLLDDCAEYFRVNDLYSLFEVSKNVKEPSLKKAYYKLSLRVHPDKAEEGKKDEANRLFQIVAKAYCVLSDKEKRAIYDEQGTVDDEDFSEDKDWEAYWRVLFPKITEADIEDYIEKYKGSDEEEEDLKKYYEKFEGDLLKVYDFIPGYNIAEEPRYREILQNMIDSGDVQDYPAFHTKENKKNTAKRLKKAEKEAKEALEARKELGLDENSDLSQAILRRQEDRSSAFSSLISGLEAKYCQPKATKKGRRK